MAWAEEGGGARGRDHLGQGSRGGEGRRVALQPAGVRVLSAEMRPRVTRVTCHGVVATLML